ncbi:hypothetical protein [uncultured Methanobrevibacter sp.]|uniref:hypothetical protein n=1 Tax=uncultured Methanobrevibacter sp. TaxID=253161 RepID=UPI002605210E|nr:hypothetical protein [uncultured Methanobrevibacter sp.]
MENKDKILYGILIVVIIIAAFIAITVESEQNKNQIADFGAFTLSVSHDSKFQQVDGDYNYVNMYIDYENNIEVLFLNSSFIEECVKNSTGYTINFKEICVDYLEEKNMTKINETSNNSNIKFYIDYSVPKNNTTQQSYAGIYSDDNQMIIIEGPDLNLVKNITQSIKIK